jgi:hypothetical protein
MGMEAGTCSLGKSDSILDADCDTPLTSAISSGPFSHPAVASRALSFDRIGQALLAGRAPYWTIPRLAGMFDPDPYHR